MGARPARMGALPTRVLQSRNPGAGWFCSGKRDGGKAHVESVLSEAGSRARNNSLEQLITRGGGRSIITRSTRTRVVGRLGQERGLSKSRKGFLEWSTRADCFPHVSGDPERIDYKGKVIVRMNRTRARMRSRKARDGSRLCGLFTLSFLNPEHELWIQGFIENRYRSICRAWQPVAP